jgi:hypothetical protein
VSEVQRKTKPKALSVTSLADIAFHRVLRK